MEYLGHVPPGTPHDVVIRGDLSGREFLAFWLRDDRVIAAMNVNIWDQGDHLKALVLAQTPVDRAALADPKVPLESWCARDAVHGRCGWRHRSSARSQAGSHSAYRVGAVHRRQIPIAASATPAVAATISRPVMTPRSSRIAPSPPAAPRESR
ncbi:oxidoreductase C-terminal domain-containing protein [Nonomuraea salmonea]|uniref:oxidoreductase C-terminal domain-containing protein n=1 Tax=Nonomuraea salmonea TaxID=46181 RepID=UPI003612D3EF